MKSEISTQLQNLSADEVSLQTQLLSPLERVIMQLASFVFASLQWCVIVLCPIVSPSRPGRCSSNNLISFYTNTSRVPPCLLPRRAAALNTSLAKPYLRTQPAKGGEQHRKRGNETDARTSFTGRGEEQGVVHTIKWEQSNRQSGKARAVPNPAAGPTSAQTGSDAPHFLMRTHRM